MNVATCTLIAQIIPLLLIATVWTNSRIAKARQPKRKGLPFWMEISGVVFGLVSIWLCVRGVNSGGLTNEHAIGFAYAGLAAVLTGVIFNVVWMHTVELPD